MPSFANEIQQRLEANDQNDRLKEDARAFTRSSISAQYSYNFTWMSRPIIQYPQDIVAMQELIWEVRPDLIIETGIAHGGSLVFSASMLAMLDYAEVAKAGTTLNPGESQRLVLGLDIDIRADNRAAIEAHPLGHMIEMIEGSSVAAEVLEQVKDKARDYERVLVCLDSNHTHNHVLRELEAYAPLVSKGSYCVVFDTIVDDMPKESFPDRPWGHGNNPKTAVHAYLKSHSEFEIDRSIDHKLMISVAPGGFLRRKR